MNVGTEQIIFGLILATFAGLSTTLGATALFILNVKDKRVVGLSMGFSAGVMISVSIFELIPEALQHLDIFIVGASFLVGMVSVTVLDFLIPHDYMHEHACMDSDEDESKEFVKNAKLLKTGRLVALGIAIHNLPEGFVTITGSIHSYELGLIVAAAIAMHNIPEGLSVAVPIVAATNNKKKAFKISFLSGLAEPLGAVLGLAALITLGILNEEIIEISLAFVSGIMIFISLDELLPAAHETCNQNGYSTHMITGGIIAGIAVMLITLVLLG